MKITEEKKYNIKLYPFYKMLSWDLLFFYSINFLFLTQVKGISASDVLLSEASYPIFKIILLMPLTVFIAKVGKRKSLILANFINAFSVLMYIVAQNFAYVVIGQFLSAVSFNIKGLVETNLLYDSLPKNEKRGQLFSKIDGRGNSWYYYADAIAAVASGFLYVINGYFPMILSLICCLVSTFLAYRFKEIPQNETEQQEVISIKEYIKDLRSSSKHMLQSKRLRYLMIFGAIFSGMLSALVSLRSGVLEELGVPEQYFGIIFAILGIVSGISAKNQNRIHNKFRNKTLAILSVPTTISCMLIGFLALGKLPYEIMITLILAMYLIQFVVKGPFYTLIKRYLNNFTTSSLREKIISAYNLIESIARTSIALLASWLLGITTASGSILVIGCITTIAIVLLLDKMRGKVGLKPEEYEKKDINFLELK